MGMSSLKGWVIKWPKQRRDIFSVWSDLKGKNNYQMTISLNYVQMKDLI